MLNVSIPSRGFWFFEDPVRGLAQTDGDRVSIPSRGFWFFEAGVSIDIEGFALFGSFNPLAGILVF